MGNDTLSFMVFPTMKTLGGTDAPKKAEKAAPAQVETAEEKIDFSNVKIEPLFEEMVTLKPSVSLISELLRFWNVRRFRNQRSC